MFTVEVTSSDLNHVLWEDRRGDVPIDFNGTPFVIVGKEVRECHNGPKRKKRKEKKKVCKHMK